MEQTLSSSDAHTKSYTMKLQTRLGSVEVEGETAVRRFDDPHRTVFTYVSAIHVSGSELVFREDGWLVLSDPEAPRTTTTSADTKSRASSLFQTLYRLHIEPRASSGDPAPSADRKYLEELVMDALSNKMRAHQHQLQILIPSGMANTAM